MVHWEIFLQEFNVFWSFWKLVQRFYHFFFKVYIAIEDVYKGKVHKVGAEGIKQLFYRVPKGTSFADSETLQQRLIQGVLTGNEDTRLPGDVMIQWVSIIVYNALEMINLWTVNCHTHWSLQISVKCSVLESRGLYI